MKANEINYGGVTFEDYQKAVSTVCRYLDGLTNTHRIHDKLTEQLKAQMIRDGHLPNPEDNTEVTEDNTEVTEEFL